eukprot:TRINITY_DN110533_c0_g1_i1.p1 TRINITY_DN110533_c0_g1~~TRINITY_DN110533_c0_g1_i1.p1  ORF type:complete len:193 (+),score=13.45 TRINITY_DN110533_c0_g1_i1:424-1002(+)
MFLPGLRAASTPPATVVPSSSAPKQIDRTSHLPPSVLRFLRVAANERGAAVLIQRPPVAPPQQPQRKTNNNRGDHNNGNRPDKRQSANDNPSSKERGGKASTNHRQQQRPRQSAAQASSGAPAATNSSSSINILDSAAGFIAEPSIRPSSTFLRSTGHSLSGSKRVLPTLIDSSLALHAATRVIRKIPLTLR